MRNSLKHWPHLAVLNGRRCDCHTSCTTVGLTDWDNHRGDKALRLFFPIFVKLVTSSSKNFKSDWLNTTAEKTQSDPGQEEPKQSLVSSHRPGCSGTFHQQQQPVTLNYRWYLYLEQVQPTGTRKRAPLCEGMSDTAPLPEHWSFHAERSSGISHNPAETPAKQVCTSATNRFQGWAWITLCY